MGSTMGYEYSYRFWMDNAIISRYSSDNIKPDIKFLFENRTYFVVKRIDGGGADEIIDSERYETGAEKDIDESRMRLMMTPRLTDYWMSDDEIRDLVHKAFTFAKQKASDPQHASCRIIPVAIQLDVCTVQQVGEPISDTIERAIRSEYLYPLCLFQNNFLVAYDQASFNEHDQFLVFSLRLVIRPKRVIDINEGLSYMEVCPICLRNPTIGAQISELSGCGHTFHYHCIIRWVLNNKLRPTCPMCRQLIFSSKILM